LFSQSRAGIENVEVDRVFQRPSFMRHVRWNTQHFAGLDHDSLPSIANLRHPPEYKSPAHYGDDEVNVRAFFHDHRASIKFGR